MLELAGGREAEFERGPGNGTVDTPETLCSWATQVMPAGVVGHAAAAAAAVAATVVAAAVAADVVAVLVAVAAGLRTFVASFDPEESRCVFKGGGVVVVVAAEAPVVAVVTAGNRVTRAPLTTASAGSCGQGMCG